MSLDSLNNLTRTFLTNYTEKDATVLIKCCRTSCQYHIGIKVGKFLEDQFPYSVDIKDEYGMCLYYAKEYTQSYNIYGKALNLKGLTEKRSKELLFNQHFSINHVKDRYIYYDKKLVDYVISKKLTKGIKVVTFTITSCKRYDLFEKTVNSFLHCCLDLNKIDKWLCVDDNSSEEDREKMKKNYPFFTFYFKNEDEKGHPKSMNIIRDKVKTPYFFHMEDDWQFFVKRKYITDAMDVLSQNEKVSQCLINKNYAETSDDIDIKGGQIFNTDRGLRYYIHEFGKIEDASKKYGTGKFCSYWPHYSFRPSLVRTKVLKNVGEFNKDAPHFEMEYAVRCFKKGYVSAFFEGIYSIHIGRLTSERHDDSKVNAYKLNNEEQFTKSETKPKDINIPTLTEFDKKIRAVVLNLDKRTDRLEKFKKNSSHLKLLNFERYSAIDGGKLVPNAQLQRIFDGNDYNMRQGIVGCAMSHIKMYIEFLQSDYEIYCIVEDDVEFVPDFDKKLLHLYSQVKDCDWDIVYLGHSARKKYIVDGIYDKVKLPIAEKWNSHTSLTRSLGGAIGYLISRKGAKNLLEFINKVGMTNAIDTMQQKAADIINVFYPYPHLVYSKCYMGESDFDTDIQRNFDSLTVSLEDRMRWEKVYYGPSIIFIQDVQTAIDIAKNKDEKDVHYYISENINILRKILENIVHPWYTLDNKVIFIVPNGNNDRYFDRLGKAGNFNIQDALQCKE